MLHEIASSVIQKPVDITFNLIDILDRWLESYT